MFVVKIIGVSLSKPHTSVTALQDVCVCVCLYVCMSVCLSVCIREAIYIERMKTKVHIHFKFSHMLKLYNVLCDKA